MIKFSKIQFSKIVFFAAVMFFSLLFCSPVTADAAAIMTVGTTSADNGQTVSIPITATGFANSVYGMDFTIIYNPTLIEYIGTTTPGVILTNGTLQVGTTSNSGTSNNLIFNWNSGSALPLDNGDVVTVRFKAVSASVTNADLAVSNAAMFDSIGDPITLSTVDGYISLNPVNTPTVTTQAASSITATTATGNGNITSIGGSSPTVRGVAYGLTTAYGATTTEAGSFSTGAFTASMTGLVCNTLYHYTAYAANTSGTSTGSDVTFTTGPCVPTVVTSAASSITMSTVTLNGSISATGGADASQSGFAYGTSATLATTIATSTLGAQTGTASFNEAVSGLTPSTTYYFRAYAKNSAGTSTGSILSFTTSAPGVPTVTTQSASSITATTATGNGNITSTGGVNATVRGVAYGLTTAYGATTTEAGSFSTGAFTASMTGLTCNTLYHYRAYAANTSGTSTASDSTFTTSPCVQTVVTSAASSITTNTATLNGSISSTGGADATQSGFAYGTSATLATTIATSTLGAQTGTASFNEPITGLTPSTTYYFRAYTKNSAGTSTGSILSFTTSAPGSATVTTEAASSITATTATGNGTITSTGGINATVRGVAYGTTIAYGATTTENGSFSTGAFTASMTGLTCNTLYHYRAYAVNTAGTSTGSDVTFTTSPCVPTVVTAAASSVTANTVTLNGSISATGGANATQSGFAYGTSASLATTIATSTLGAQTGTASFNEPISGLTPSTTYYFRAYAKNSAGTSTGSILSFTTSAATAPTSPRSLATSSLTGISVILSWLAPISDGASTITHQYLEVYDTLAGATSSSIVLSSSALSTTVSSLTSGRAYIFYVSAVNSIGTSTPATLNQTMPAVPGIPASLATTSQAYNQVDLSWTAPVSNGGAAITDYNIVYNTGGATTTWSHSASTGTTASVTGLSGSTMYTFAVAATNVAGTGSQRYLIVTTPATPPSVTISASPTSVSSGGSSNITWSSTNASTCTTTKAGVDWDYSTSNSVTSGPLTASTIFTITCTGAGGSTSASATVGIASSGGNSSGGGGGYVPFTPTMTLTASPTSVASGASAMISWNSSMVGSCFITKAGASWYIGTSTSGSKSSGPITSPTTFSALCGGTFGVAFKNVTVGVIGLTQGLFNTNLSMGMTHPDVARLQQFLNGRGYTVSTTGIGSAGQESNYFGLKTQQALMRFQTDNHIVPPNGKLGPITRTLINSLLGGTTSPVTITPPTTPISTTTTTYVFTRSLTLGATGADVKALQVYLNSHGSPVAISGPGSIGNESNYFGMATKNALAKFQKAHSIEPAEGYFGQITRTFINNN